MEDYFSPDYEPRSFWIPSSENIARFPFLEKKPEPPKSSEPQIEIDSNGHVMPPLADKGAAFRIVAAKKGGASTAMGMTDGLSKD